MSAEKKPKIAIIGAGASSVFLSQLLVPYFQIDCFEKSRGVGGRAAYRRHEAKHFIHGAQAFTVRDESFLEYLKPFEESALLEEWAPKLINFDQQGKTFKRLWYEKRYGHKHSLARFLKDTANFDSLYTQTKINSIELNQKSRVILKADDKILGDYMFCIVTAPPVQAKQILEFELKEEPHIQLIQSQYVSMVSLEHQNRSQWEIAYAQDDMFLQKIVRMKSESGLSNDYVLHSKVLDNPDDLSKDDLKPKAFDQMRQEFLSFIQADENLIEHEQHHFWRYRKTKLNTEQKFYCCKNEKVYICGDSFVESNDIEAAFLSAQAVFDDLKQKGAIHV